MESNDTTAGRAAGVSGAIATLQAHARDLTAAQAWDPSDLEERTLFLLTEVGELAREVLRLRSAHTELQAAEARDRLGLEMYDVVWNLCDLANGAGIDLGAASARKIAINQERSW